MLSHVPTNKSKGMMHPGVWGVRRDPLFVGALLYVIGMVCVFSSWKLFFSGKGRVEAFASSAKKGVRMAGYTTTVALLLFLYLLFFKDTLLEVLWLSGVTTDAFPNVTNRNYEIRFAIFYVGGIPDIRKIPTSSALGDVRCIFFFPASNCVLRMGRFLRRRQK